MCDLFLTDYCCMIASFVDVRACCLNITSGNVKFAAAEQNDLKEYLINTIDLIRNKHPVHGLVILGDLNDLEIRTLSTSQNLKQVVDQPTREPAILDPILTNLHDLYDRPDILAPLGSSDHNTVYWPPSVDSTSSHSTQVKSVKFNTPLS